MHALILAGGAGERLRPLTDLMPKPMVPILGKPILWYQLIWLRHHGVTQVIILGGYKWQAIKDYFGNGKQFGLRISYSIEDQPLGRGGALRKGLSLVPCQERTVVATNGDVITNENLGAILGQHQKSGKRATLMVVPFCSPFGVVDCDANNNVFGFHEKAKLPYWVNGGVYVMDKAIEMDLPERGNHEDVTFPRLAEEGRLGVYRSSAMWQTVDSPKDLRECEQSLLSLEPSKDLWARR